jgi:hypothetical protein
MKSLKPEFAVYEDYEGKLHIVDGNERVILSDSYAYDNGLSAAERKKNAISRMEDIATALNIGLSDEPAKSKFNHANYVLEGTYGETVSV